MFERDQLTQSNQGLESSVKTMVVDKKALWSIQSEQLTQAITAGQVSL